MKKNKFFSAYNHPGIKIPSRDYGPSVTQPDDSLTIEQILTRVSMGLTTGIGASVNDDDYDDDDDFDDPTLQPGFDKLDALALSTSEETADKFDKIDQARKRVLKKKSDDEFKKMVDEEIARRKQEESQE